MSVFRYKVVTAYRIAYGTEYSKMELFTKPKIYHGGTNYDLSKRWYVYFSYRNPETEEMTRQTPIYLDINSTFKTKKERLNAIKILRNEVEKLLKEGYSPYDTPNEVAPPEYSAESCLLYALNIKKSAVAEKSYKDYKDKANVFIRYLRKQGLSTRAITEITKRDVLQFLNEKTKQTSNATRNSYRRSLSALFTILENEDYIPKNFIQSIPIIKATPTKNKSYTSTEVTKIYEYLEQKDKDLLLLIKFVSYCFLRPVEACRLQVKDVDLELQQLRVKTKTKASKLKRIPSIMIEELQKLDLSNPHAYFITAYGVAESDASADDRRALFTKRYRKVRNKLGFDADYTIYSFRHTFITRVYRELRKSMGKFETYDALMGITGHSTITALTKYLRDIDAELPEDYSDLLQCLVLKNRYRLFNGTKLLKTIQQAIAC